MSRSAAAAEVFERRVRPVYDAIDNRNYKNALKLCDGLVDKYKDNQLVKILRAMSLCRLGRRAEAGKLCDVLLEAGPEMEEHAVGVLKIVLKELGRPQDITRMYEGLHKQDPGNTDIMASLFHAYAREMWFVKQQQMAVKLLKESGGQERYQWWIILSLVMQVRAALQQQQDASGSANAGGGTALQLLQLAESMAARQAGKAGRVEGFEALLVWVDLMLARGQPKAALAVLEGPVGSSVLMQGGERTALHADLLALCGDVQGAAAVLAARLRANPDDWAALCGYLDCVLPSTAAQPVLHTSFLLWLEGGLAQRMAAPKQSAPGTSDPDPVGLRAAAAAQAPSDADAAVAAAQALLVELCTAAGPLISAGGPGAPPAQRRCMRGPYLAQVELAARQALLLRQHAGTGHQDSPADQTVAAAMLGYVTTAGHLVSCAADLRTYTRTLSAPSAAWLVDQLGSQGLLACDSASELSTDDLRRRVCAQQLREDLRQPAFTSDSAALQHAIQLMGLYQSSQHMYKGLDARERGPADELPVLSASILMEAAMRQQDSTRAMHWALLALITLEAAVVNRPYASAMRLSLMALHSLLASPALAAAHQSALEIKNIQLDSVAGHHLLPALLAYDTGAGVDPGSKACPPGSVQRLLRDTLQLFQDHQRNAGDTLDVAYKHGTYSKVLESIAFKERLDASHTRAVARAETVATALRTAAVMASASSSLGTSLASAALASLADNPLPWSELPSLGGSTGLRFNEDLATRPGWHPPVAGPAGLACCAWWQHRAVQASSARGQCAWWCSPGAAEGASQEAQDLRTAQAGAVRQRWCTVHVLLHTWAAFKQCDLTGVTGAAPDVQTALEALGHTLVAEPGGNTDAWLQQQLTSSQQDVCVLLPAAAYAVLAAGSSAAAACTSQGGGAGAPVQGEVSTAVDRLVLACTLLHRACSALCTSLQEAAQSEPTMLLPGSVLAAANTLLAEPVAWLVAMLEVIPGAIKASSRTAKGKKATTGSPDNVLTATQPLVSCVTSSAASLAEQLSTLHSALSGVQGQVEGQAEGTSIRVVEALSCLEGVQTSGLWDWQQPAGFEAQSVLQQVAVSQRDLLRHLLAHVTQLSTRISKLVA